MTSSCGMVYHPDFGGVDYVCATMRNWPYAKIEDNGFGRLCQQIRGNIKNIEEIES